MASGVIDMLDALGARWIDWDELAKKRIASKRSRNIRVSCLIVTKKVIAIRSTPVLSLRPLTFFDMMVLRTPGRSTTPILESSAASLPNE